MKNKEELDHFVNQVKALANSDFTVNEGAILADYKRQQNGTQSIAIKALIIIGGILTSLFIVAFMFLMGIYKSTPTLIFIGIISLNSAIILTRKTNEIFLATFLITLFGVGYATLALGLLQTEIGHTIIIGLLLSISCSTLFVVDNYVLTSINCLIITGLCIILLSTLNLAFLTPIFSSLIGILMTITLLNEAKIITFSKHLSRIYTPLAMGLILSFCISLFPFSTYSFTDNFDHSIFLSQFAYYTKSVLLLGLVLYLQSFVLKILQIKDFKQRILLYSIALIVFIPTSMEPSIIGSLIIIILCFLTNHRMGIVIGIASFLYFIATFYYNMEVSLLEKSILLFVSGLLFLGFYLITSKKLSEK